MLRPEAYIFSALSDEKHLRGFELYSNVYGIKIEENSTSQERLSICIKEALDRKILDKNHQNRDSAIVIDCNKLEMRKMAI